MDEAPRTTTIWERAAAPLAGISAGAFAALSAVRRNRVFHPVGEAYSGAIELDPQRGQLGDLRVLAGTHDATVRFSRAAGTPEPLPDVLGIAIRIHLESSDQQDLLLASSGGAPVARNLLVPARSFFRPIYSTVLPYRAGGRQFVFGARGDASLRGRKGDFGDLQRAAESGVLRFDILVAELSGPWETIGSLEIGQPREQDASHALRFNPWNTRSELQPAGPLNTLRRSSYIASQEARPTTPP